MRIGEKIRTARKAMGLSQETLAEKLGVSVQAVSTWERGENLPETRKLISLAKELRVSLDDLVSEEEGDGWTAGLLSTGRILDKAIAYAAFKHSGMNRKGTNTPYIVHPIEVTAIVSGLTDDEEVMAAAALHDVIEDAGVTQEELAQAFNERIAGLVAEESENKREDQPAADTWKERKEESIAHLKQASHEVKVIALGDKLANIRAIQHDYETQGDEIWKRFNETDKTSHAWYYCEIYWALEADPELADTPYLNEFSARIYDVFADKDAEEEEEEDDEENQSEEEELRICCFYADAISEFYEKAPKNTKAWALILDQTEDADLKQIQIMAMIYDFFLRSDSIGFADTHLVLTNDPNGENVAWERLPDGYAIHLCAASARHWCQVAYQLGYAMMHCLIDHLYPDEPEVTWAEELISEAGTLALLKMLAAHWGKTPFGKEDSEYAQAILNYIDDNLADQGTSALMRCPDRETLRRLNEANRFDDRINESHDLFSSIQDGDLLRLAEIRKYATDELLLYTHSWRGWSDGSQAVAYICRLQEQIPGCELPAGIQIEINLENSRPTEAQRKLYAGLIRSMEYLPEEYIIFDFLDPNKGECEQIGLVFYQVIRRKDGRILAEIRLDTKAGRKMYRLYCDDDHAVGILNDLLMHNKVPELADWEDITDQIFDS